MRIVAGQWRGRALTAPPGGATRPTADRVRQALFNMLLHAPWGGRDRIAGATVLDAFAGTGALGLEALSRGAARAHFIERDHAALTALRGNIARLRAAAVVHEGEATRPPPGVACSLVFLDPPYGQGLVELALAALGAARWIARGALLVAECGRHEELALEGSPWAGEVLAERSHGMAKVTILRAAARQA